MFLKVQNFLNLRWKIRIYSGVNHGGGKIEYFGENVTEPVAFKYKSPCPNGGTHAYESIFTAQF